MVISICLHQPMKHCKKKFLSFNRSYKQLYGLLFFALLFVLGCRNDPKQTDISIVWTAEKPTAITIPLSLLPQKNDSAVFLLATRVEGSQTSILGNYRMDGALAFEPLIPFTRGSKYQLYYRDSMIATFHIPLGDSANVRVMNVYPQKDTLPNNLLKIYLQFSSPMRENVSAQYIQLTRNGTDTLREVFLDLQPELWNEDRTVLTVWLDPGRIKRELQPNQRLGNPLQEGSRYELLIAKEWKNAKGVPLQQDHKHSFTVGGRDSLPPDPAQWVVLPPGANSTAPLLIILNESLDHFLLNETIQVADKHGNIIKGQFHPEKKDSQCRFIPSTPWLAGEYHLLIDASLEDLAGNNLNKPFDRDMTKTKAPSTERVYRKNFQIGK
jgi:hypothetical protein